MNNQQMQALDPGSPMMVGASRDRFGEVRGLGISTITFKRTPAYLSDTLIIENSFRAKGGPPKHFHYHQDEWFCVIDGEFTFEIGLQRYNLTRGDSLFAPRRVPHVWAVELPIEP